MLKSLNPLEPIQPLKPLQPLRVVEPLKPLQPLQPFSGQQRRSTYGAPGYRDPYAIDSISDVFLNTQGRYRQLARRYGAATNDMDYLTQVVLSSMAMLKNQYAEPIIKGDFFRAGYNALGSLAEDIDVVSNMTKGAIVEADSELASLVIGGLSGLVAGAATIASGGTFGMALLSGMAISGVSATVTALASNPEDAVKGIIRGSGLGPEGRHYYTFDIQTGNPFTDYLANVAAEIAIDPLNWGSFTARFLNTAAYRLHWDISESTLGILKYFEKADRLVTSMAFYGNPLTGSLKAVVGGTRFVKSFLARQLVESAMTYAANMKDTPIQVISELLTKHDYVQEHINKVLRRFSRTGELSFIKGKRISQLSFDWYTRFSKYLERAGLSADKVPEFIRFYMEGLWYEDPTFYGKVLGQIPEKFQDIIASFGREFFDITGTSAGVIKHYKTGGFEGAQKAVSAFLDSLMDSGNVGNMIRQTVEMDLQGIAETITQKAGGSKALNDMPYTERLPYIYNALVERFPNEFDDKKLASIEKNGMMYRVLDRMANYLGVSLDEVISYRMTMNEVLYSPETRASALLTLASMEGTSEVVVPRKLGLLPLAKSVTEALPVARDEGISDFLFNMRMEILYKGGILDPNYPPHFEWMQAFDSGQITPFKEVMESKGVKIGEFDAKQKEVFFNVLDDFVNDVETTETVAIKKWLDDVEKIYPDFLRLIETLPDSYWKATDNLGAEKDLLPSDTRELFHTFRDLHVIIRYVADKRGKLTPKTKEKLFELYSKLNDKKFLKTIQTLINAGFGVASSKAFGEFFLVRPQFGIKERAAVTLQQEGKYVLQVNKRAASLDIFQALSETHFGEDQGYTLIELFDSLSDADREPVARLIVALATLDLSNTPFEHLAKAAKMLYRQMQGYAHYGQLLSSVNDILDSVKKVSSIEKIPVAERGNLIPLKIGKSKPVGGLNEKLAKAFGVAEQDAYFVHAGSLESSDAALIPAKKSGVADSVSKVQSVISGEPAKVIGFERIKEISEVVLKAKEEIEKTTALVKPLEEAQKNLVKKLENEVKEFVRDAEESARVAAKEIKDELDKIPDHEAVQDFHKHTYYFLRSRKDFKWQHVNKYIKQIGKFFEPEGHQHKYYVSRIQVDLGLPGAKSLSPKGHMRFSITPWRDRPAYKGIVDSYGVEHSTTETYVQLIVMERRMSDALRFHASKQEGQEFLAEELKQESVAEEKLQLERYLNYLDPKREGDILKPEKLGVFQFLYEFIPKRHLKRTAVNTLTVPVLRKATRAYINKKYQDEISLGAFAPLFSDFDNYDDATKEIVVLVMRDFKLPKNVIIPHSLKHMLKPWNTKKFLSNQVQVKKVSTSKGKNITNFKFPRHAVLRFTKKFRDTGNIKEATRELFKNEDGTQNDEMLNLLMANKALNNKIVEPELARIFTKINKLGVQMRGLASGSDELKALQKQRDKLFKTVRELQDLFNFSKETSLDLARHGFLYFTGQNPNFRNAIMGYSEEELVAVYGADNYDDFIAPTRGYLALFFPQRTINADPTILFEPSEIVWDNAKISAFMGLNKYNSSEAKDLFVAIMLNDPKITSLVYKMDGPLSDFNGAKTAFESMRNVYTNASDKVKAVIYGPDGQIFGSLNNTAADAIHRHEDPFKQVLLTIRGIRDESKRAEARGEELAEGEIYINHKLREFLPYSEDLKFPTPKYSLDGSFGIFAEISMPGWRSLKDVYKYFLSTEESVKKGEVALTNLKKFFGVEIDDPKEAIAEVEKNLREVSKFKTAPFGSFVDNWKVRLWDKTGSIPSSLDASLLPVKIISGGQTGGDRGGLLGAKDLGVKTGGTAPKGLRTEVGSDPTLASEFGLEEDDSSNYTDRTKKNVDNSDVTIVFIWNPKTSVGSVATAVYANSGKWGGGTYKTSHDGHRPVIVITTDDPETAALEIIDFFDEHFFLKGEYLKTVNIAGERESKAPGIEEFVRRVIKRAFSKAEDLVAEIEGDVYSPYEPVPGHPVKVVHPHKTKGAYETIRLNERFYSPEQRSRFKNQMRKLIRRNKRYIYDNTLAGVTAMNGSFKFNKDGTFDVEAVRYEEIDRKTVKARYGAWFFSGLYTHTITSTDYRQSGSGGAIAPFGGSNEVIEKFNFKNPYIHRYLNHVAIGLFEEIVTGFHRPDSSAPAFQKMFKFVEAFVYGVLPDVENLYLQKHVPGNITFSGSEHYRLLGQDYLDLAKDFMYSLVDNLYTKSETENIEIPIDVRRKWVDDVLLELMLSDSYSLHELVDMLPYILATRIAVWHARRLGYDGLIGFAWDTRQRSGFSKVKSSVDGYWRGSPRNTQWDNYRTSFHGAEPKLEYARVSEVLSLLEANDTDFELPTAPTSVKPKHFHMKMEPVIKDYIDELEAYNNLNGKTYDPNVSSGRTMLHKDNLYILRMEDFPSLDKIYEDISKQRESYFLIQNMIDAFYHHLTLTQFSPFRLIFDKDNINPEVIKFFENVIIPTVTLDRVDWESAVLKSHPSYQDGARLETHEEYTERIYQEEVTKKAEQTMQATKHYFSKFFPEFAEYFDSMTPAQWSAWYRNPKVTAEVLDKILSSRTGGHLTRGQIIESVFSTLEEYKRLTFTDWYNLTLKDSIEDIQDSLVATLGEQEIVQQSDGSLIIPRDKYDIVEFEQEKIERLPKDVRKAVFDTLLNQLEGNHMLPAMDVLSLYSVEKIKSRLLLIPGMEQEEEIAQALAEVVYKYLELQADSGANTIDLPSSLFIEALGTFFDPKYGVGRLLDEVDSLELQKGFSAAAVEEFLNRFFPDRASKTFGITQGLNTGVTEIEFLNRKLSEYYVDLNGSTTNDLLNLASEIGLEKFENNPEFASILARFIRTGVPFEKKLYQTQRELKERELLNNPGFSQTDILQRHEALIQSTTSNPNRELAVLKQNQEFQQAMLDKHWMKDPGKRNVVLRYMDTLHADAGFGYQLLIDFAEYLEENPDAARMFNLAANYKDFDTQKFDLLYEMDPYDFAAFMHHNTFGVFAISRRVMGGKEFHPDILSKYKAFGIDILAEDKDSIWFHVSKPELAVNFEKPNVTYKATWTGAYLKLFTTLQDYMQAHSDNILPFDVTLGGVPRINGESFAAFGLERKVLTDEMAQELLVKSQYSGEMKMMFLGDFDFYRSVIERDGSFPPGSPFAMIRSTVFSLINHTNAKTVYLQHVFAPEFQPQNLFSTDPVEAHKMFVSDKVFRAIALAGTEVVDVTDLVRQGPKQMQWAFDHGVAITTWDGMVKLYNKTNHFNMPKILDWWNKTIMSMYRAAFITVVTGARNLVFDNPPRLLGVSKGSFDILGYMPKAVRMDMKATELIKRLGTFNNFEQFRDAYLSFSPEEQYLISLIQMLIKNKILDAPLAGLMEITKDARVEKLLRGIKVDDATLIQKIVWSNPSTRAGVALMGYGERIYRLAAILYLLDEGKEMPEATSIVLKWFLDYNYRPKSVQILNMFIPFGVFAVANTAMWADNALENPYLLRMIIQASTEGFIDENHRKKRNATNFEMKQALQGNFNIGKQIFKTNPSFFDAIGLAMQTVEDPMSRAMPIIRDLPGFLAGDKSSVELPFQGEAKKYGAVMNNLLQGTVDDVSDVMPWVAYPQYNSTYPRRSRSLGYTPYPRTSYSLQTGYGAGKMASRYGGIGMRSSNFQRKAYIDRGFYSTLYTKTGKSRLGIRANTKPTYKNLAARIKDQSYMFK